MMIMMTMTGCLVAGFVLFGAITYMLLAILPSFLFLFFLSFWTSLHSTLVSILLLGWVSLIYRDDT
jgi:chromate transport protein ChrA